MPTVRDISPVPIDTPDSIQPFPGNKLILMHSGKKNA